jgi:hypothetical protein
MAGILPDLFGILGGGHGVLPFGDASAAPNPADANRNAILGYLAGALQGGNLGQSIGHGLQGWLTGAQTDAAEQARHAATQYVAQQPDIDAGMRFRADAKPGARNAVPAGQSEAAHDPRHRRVRIRPEARLQGHAAGFHPAQARRRAPDARMIER